MLLVCGMVGVAAVLLAYALMTTGKLTAETPLYQWLNVGGAAGILLSLVGQWNLAAFVTNVIWLGIGAVALVRIHRKRRSV